MSGNSGKFLVFFSQGESLEALKGNIQDAYDLVMQETMQVPVKKFKSTELKIDIP